MAHYLSTAAGLWHSLCGSFIGHDQKDADQHDKECVEADQAPAEDNEEND